MKKTKSRILASFVAVMLCFTAFSTVAFANGNDPEAKPETTASTEQAEETEAPTTGGIEDISRHFRPCLCVAVCFPLNPSKPCLKPLQNQRQAVPVQQVYNSSIPKGSHS